MSANNPPKKKPTGSYPVGYARPPAANRFPPGVSGNAKGRPAGRPSLNDVLLEENARIVKVKVGEEIMHIDKDRAVVRKLYDMALQGDIAAARHLLMMRDRAQVVLETAPNVEPPLTEEELDVVKIMANRPRK